MYNFFGISSFLGYIFFFRHRSLKFFFNVDLVFFYFLEGTIRDLRGNHSLLSIVPSFPRFHVPRFLSQVILVEFFSWDFFVDLSHNNFFQLGLLLHLSQYIFDQLGLLLHLSQYVRLSSFR